MAQLYLYWTAYGLSTCLRKLLLYDGLTVGSINRLTGWHKIDRLLLEHSPMNNRRTFLLGFLTAITTATALPALAGITIDSSLAKYHRVIEFQQKAIKIKAMHVANGVRISPESDALFTDLFGFMRLNFHGDPMEPAALLQIDEMFRVGYDLKGSKYDSMDASRLQDILEAVVPVVVYRNLVANVKLDVRVKENAEIIAFMGTHATAILSAGRADLA